ncbi:ICMT Protein-S-isoprenylcysteine O-methyltransferase [Candida maltosa Xu316]
MSILSRGNLSQYSPYHVNLLKVALKSFLLGTTFTINLIFLLSNNSLIYPEINVYFISLVIFYSLEFITTVIWNNSQVDDDSFILEDKEIHMVTIASLLEFYFIHWSYSPRWIGLVLVIVGQFIRTLSMYTASESFNHYIQRSAKEKHTLITHGVYSIFRHPSYFGFFVWFIGLQVFLNNVVILIVGGVVLWRFFRDRIVFEERFLVDFFGNDYIEYRKKTRTWMMI